MVNDREIVQRILSGETKAFREIIDNYGRLVNHMVYSMLGDSPEREDICQEVFLKVYKNLSGFRHEAKLSSWIARIAVNHCRDFMVSRKMNYDGEVGEDILAGIPDDGPDIEETLDKSRRAMLIRKEIDSLPPSYRTIITLYHLDEFSYEEISRTLKMPLGTVKNYIFRAREILRQRLLACRSQEELMS